AGAPRCREAPKARMSTMRELDRIFKPASGVARCRDRPARRLRPGDFPAERLYGISVKRPQFEKSSLKSQGSRDRLELEPRGSLALPNSSFIIHNSAFLRAILWTSPSSSRRLRPPS